MKVCRAMRSRRGDRRSSIAVVADEFRHGPAGQREWAERLARIFGEIEISLWAQGLI
jgi:hypothetical protein